MHEGPYFEYAPGCEQEVVVLFGMLLPHLPYRLVIDEVRTEFPDCLATRLDPNGSSIPIRVEFEHVASNFRDHNHDPTGCDLIICWEDDLGTDYPVERLALRGIAKAVGAPIHRNPDRPKYERTFWTRETFLAESPPELLELHEKLLAWADGQGHVRFGEGKKIASWNLYLDSPRGPRFKALNAYADGTLWPATRQDVAPLPDDVRAAYLHRMADVAGRAAVWEQAYYHVYLGKRRQRQALMDGIGEMLRALSV